MGGKTGGNRRGYRDRVVGGGGVAARAPCSVRNCSTVACLLSAAECGVAVCFRPDSGEALDGSRAASDGVAVDAGPCAPPARARRQAAAAAPQMSQRCGYPIHRPRPRPRSRSTTAAAAAGARAAPGGTPRRADHGRAGAPRADGGKGVCPPGTLEPHPSPPALGRRDQSAPARRLPAAAGVRTGAPRRRGRGRCRHGNGGLPPRPAPVRRTHEHRRQATRRASARARPGGRNDGRRARRARGATAGDVGAAAAGSARTLAILIRLPRICARGSAPPPFHPRRVMASARANRAARFRRPSPPRSLYAPRAARRAA
ncbi:hypothetical protein BU14_2665s0001 [Porphyra umbilicalis]|uniref:Uncharacterized protein n=1 Tax=Porphyra umbilicalis TaxID=2786 RepID=A0A1X6NIZ0_PORUM|nr:hypothetical protein BU14_2665s0001 [Porphyra umbilicalis]|eukprot:OSX68510.1 hypothetical protein BU14_2665s0001 [Porphyra umbilicalis]